MSNILQIGYTCEGTTDIRFLSNVIRRTFEDAALNCNSNIEVYEPVYLKKSGNSFVEQITNVAKTFHYFHVICVHCDADSIDPNIKMTSHINPAFNAVKNIEDKKCNNLIDIIPIQMTESWMMADLDLLRKKIGTNKPLKALNMPNRIGLIEQLSNPKETIINAIRIAHINCPKRRKSINISNLYSPISQELDINSLKKLSSYHRFYNNALSALRKLNYIR